MAKRFSRKDYEKMIDEARKESKIYFESEDYQKRIEKNKHNPLTNTPAFLELMAALKNSEKIIQNIPTFFKNLRDKQEHECELVLKSMDAYAEKNGLIKPMDKDEFAGFY